MNFIESFQTKLSVKTRKMIQMTHHNHTVINIISQHKSGLRPQVQEHVLLSYLKSNINKFKFELKFF